MDALAFEAKHDGNGFYEKYPDRRSQVEALIRFVNQFSRLLKEMHDGKDPYVKLPDIRSKLERAQTLVSQIGRGGPRIVARRFFKSDRFRERERRRNTRLNLSELREAAP